MSMKKVLAGLAALGLVAPAFAGDVYDVDADHTSLGFSVKHMVVSSTKGSFGTFQGTVEVEAGDPLSLKAEAVIDAASIDTGNKDRDDHLRSAEFFDAATYPEIKFVSTAVEQDGDGHVLRGNLTMKDVTKEISIPVSINGPVTDPWGNERIGFEGSTKINRQDWGINFSKVMDNGGLLVGDEVKIDVSVEAIKRKEAAPAAEPAS